MYIVNPSVTHRSIRNGMDIANPVSCLLKLKKDHDVLIAKKRVTFCSWFVKESPIFEIGFSKSNLTPALNSHPKREL